MDRLTVEPNASNRFIAVLAPALMIPLGVASLVMGVRGRFNPVGVGIGVAMLATCGWVFWLWGRGRLRSVRSFTGDGLERNDGRRLAWTGLDRVVYQMKLTPARQKRLWRTEIHFEGGEVAWLLPLRVGNADAVSAYVASLPCDHTEQVV